MAERRRSTRPRAPTLRSPDDRQSRRQLLRTGVTVPWQVARGRRVQWTARDTSCVEDDMKGSGRWTRCVLALSGVVTLGACSDATAPSAPAVRLSMSGFAIAQDATPEQLAVAQLVAGFGGYFLDETGAPTVYLTDPSRRADAEQALAGFLADRGFTSADLRVRQGAYDYGQLDAWYRLARPGAFRVSGIVLGDVDEARNRIRFGVADAAAAAAVRDVVAQLGIPSAAVLVEQRAPFATVATLRDDVSPIQGGLQINFLNVGGVVGVSLLCTLGFNAVMDGESSFITNSHCSQVEGGEETPTDYYQPLQDPDRDRMVNPENLIATEADDPHWAVSLDCPLAPAFQCRWSDASRARYIPTAAAEARLGRIARTVRPSTSLTDVELTIDGFFTIKREQARGVVGEVANKVGRTTGWTYGTTTETCVDVIALGTTHIRLCQEIVAAVVDGGDSGSPVFRRNGGSNVTLLGVLWGGSTDDANPEFVYSPMWGIERELGLLTTF